MANNKPWLVKKEENVTEVMGAKIHYVKKISQGASREAQRQAVQVDPNTGKMSVDTSLMIALRTLFHITDWELTDENDKKLPVTLDVMDSLDSDFVAELTAKIQEVSDDEVTEEEKKA